MITPRDCEIWLGEAKGAVGSQQAKLRPWLIISNNANNTFSPMLNAIPITTKSKKNLPVHAMIRAGEVEGIYQDSVISVEGMTSVNKIDFVKKIGVASEDIQDRVCYCVLIQMPMIQRYLNRKIKEGSYVERQRVAM